jgi:hypothetical protein
MPAITLSLVSAVAAVLSGCFRWSNMSQSFTSLTPTSTIGSRSTSLQRASTTCGTGECVRGGGGRGGEGGVYPQHLVCRGLVCRGRARGGGGAVIGVGADSLLGRVVSHFGGLLKCGTGEVSVGRGGGGLHHQQWQHEQQQQQVTAAAAEGWGWVGWHRQNRGRGRTAVTATSE